MKRILMLIILLFTTSGCSNFIEMAPKEAYSTEPTTAVQTTTSNLLRNLPPPSQPITLAIYEFGDYTGQNKPGTGQSFSRAVTQGGLSIVKKALLDASQHKWFRVLERGGLNNLLQERQIIRSMRSTYAGPDGKPLPDIDPMLYAGILLEGGIISYESNVLTGGIGARYLGIGGSTMYSRDMVTVYLRVVSVKTGEVLVSVNSTKTIFSQKLSGGLFKFVSYDEIVEGEAGVSYNEPPQLAVRQATEFAVYSMVIEGARQGLWEFADPSTGARIIADYERNNLGIKPQNIEMAQNAEPAKPEIESADGHAEPQLPATPSPSKINASAEPPSNTSPTTQTQSANVTQSSGRALHHVDDLEKVLQDDSNLPSGWYLKVKQGERMGQAEASLIASLERAGLRTSVTVLGNSWQPAYVIFIGPYQSKSRIQTFSEGYGFAMLHK